MYSSQPVRRLRRIAVRYESSWIVLKSQPGRVDVVYATASSGRPEVAALSNLFESINIGSWGTGDAKWMRKNRSERRTNPKLSNPRLESLSPDPNCKAAHGPP